MERKDRKCIYRNLHIYNSDGYFFQYSVALYYEKRGKTRLNIGYWEEGNWESETYDAEMDHKELAYDGEKTLFTVGSGPYQEVGIHCCAR